MSTVLVAVIVTVAVGLLLCSALIWGCERLADRRRLDSLVKRLHAEARIDQLTRQSIQAMRDAARGQR